jgi:hypothetical protein
MAQDGMPATTPAHPSWCDKSSSPTPVPLALAQAREPHTTLDKRLATAANPQS